MPTNNSPAAENAASSPQANTNGNVLRNNGCPSGRDELGATDPVTGSEIFRELWLINGPFEESWMSAFNVEVWGGEQTWRNDATGYSFDE
jgi:hypothetical protein